MPSRTCALARSPLTKHWIFPSGFFVQALPIRSLGGSSHSQQRKWWHATPSTRSNFLVLPDAPAVRRHASCRCRAHRSQHRSQHRSRHFRRRRSGVAFAHGGSAAGTAACGAALTAVSILRVAITARHDTAGRGTNTMWSTRGGAMITTQCQGRASSRLRGIVVLLVSLASTHHRTQRARIGGSMGVPSTSSQSSHWCSWERHTRAGRAMMPVDRPPPPTTEAVSANANRGAEFCATLRDAQASCATRSRAVFSPYAGGARSSPCQGIHGTLVDTANRDRAQGGAMGPLTQGQRPRSLGLGGPGVPWPKKVCLPGGSGPRRVTRAPSQVWRLSTRAHQRHDLSF